MQKNTIEWCRNPDGSQGFSWNAIRGRCPVRCSLPDGRVYCYGHKHYDLRPWLEEGIGSGPGCLMNHEVSQPVDRKKPAGIFVCSLFELFYPGIEWYRDVIFHTIKQCPQHRFYILTKFPQNIDREIPDNVWLGVSVTEPSDMLRTFRLGEKTAKVRFVSIEPYLEKVDPYLIHHSCNWIIVGRLTQHGNKYNPPKEWIERLVVKARDREIPIFMKNNLRSIWGEDLIQEFPEGR